MAQEGSVLHFAVDVDSSRALRGVYLFDSGYPVQYLTAPPWEFSLPFSREAYRLTQYSQVGTRKQSPDFGNALHSFNVYAVDDRGETGCVTVPRRVVLADGLVGARGVRSVQRIPGRVRFSETEKGIADRLRTGDPVLCEVNVLREGAYLAVLDYACIHDDNHRLLMFVDDRFSAVFECPPGKDYKTRPGIPVKVRLPAGRHRIAFVAMGFIFAGPVEFKSLE